MTRSFEEPVYDYDRGPLIGSVAFPEELLDGLRTLAEINDTSVADEIHEAVRIRVEQFRAERGE